MDWIQLAEENADLIDLFFMDSHSFIIQLFLTRLPLSLAR